MKIINQDSMKQWKEIDNQFKKVGKFSMLRCRQSGRLVETNELLKFCKGIDIVNFNAKSRMTDDDRNK
jgi:hypothetical protein